MRILVLAPEFPKLYPEIINELISMGHTVEYIPDISQSYNPYYNTAYLRPIKRLIYKISNPNLKYHKQYKTIYSQKWDVFLCINGWSFEKEIIELLRRYNNSIKTVLYLWDSLRFFNFKRLFDNFNEIFTFDPIDSNNNGINYLPLYWIPVKESNNIAKYDLSFIGSLHSDRYSVLSNIKRQCNDNSLSYYLKLVTPQHKWQFKEWIKYRLTYYSSKDEYKSFREQYELKYSNKGNELISHKYLDPQLVHSITATSKCILDIEIPTQSGVTNRMIQSLSQKKKIITTNNRISLDSFFGKNPNILILNRKNPVIDIDFINSPFVDSTYSIESMNKLRIDNWLRTLIE